MGAGPVKAFRLTPKQYEALSKADDAGFVNAHGRTIQALVSYGLVEAEHRWIQKPAYRHTGVYGRTQSVWGVYGYKITNAGIQERATEDYRRKEIARFRNA